MKRRRKKRKKMNNSVIKNETLYLIVSDLRKKFKNLSLILNEFKNKNYKLKNNYSIQKTKTEEYEIKLVEWVLFFGILVNFKFYYL
jgi:hypothetical protein